MTAEKKNKFYNMWPLHIGEFFNPEHSLIKNKLVDFFKEYEKKLPKGNHQLIDENYSGNYDLYQSKYNLHSENNEALTKLFKFIAQAFLTMGKKANEKTLIKLKNINTKFNINLHETWFVRYNKGGVVFPHKHDGCSWCCVYYVQIGKDSGRKNGSTFFLRPYHGNSKQDFGAKYLREDTSVFNPEEGKLLIWPNFLYHGSHPYQGKEDRIIISANSTIDLINDKQDK